MKKVIIAMILAVLLVGCEEIKTKNGNQLLVECFDGKDRVFSALTDEIKVDGDYLKFKVVESNKDKQIEKVGLINFKCLVQEMTADQVVQMKKTADEQAKKFEEQKKAYEAAQVEAAKKPVVDTKKSKKK